MQASKYQEAIYSEMGNGDSNLGVKAVAGSGKSTTLEHGLGHLPNQKTAMFAFNKDIVLALESRMARTSKKPKDLTISTINAFGWKICTGATGLRQVSKFKDDDLMKRFLTEDQANIFYKWKGLLGRIISLAKANLEFGDLNQAKIQSVADEYGLDIPSDPMFLELVQNVWDISSNLDGIMNFNDQIYMPLKKGWAVPKFATALVDELQDLNPAQQELMLRACDRFIGVGDPRQAIYAFAGADAKSMANMIRRTNAKELPLSVCYRCPISVVKEAKKIVPEIEWCDFAPQGIVDSVKNEQFRGLAKENDFVLCRTTAPLVSECLRMIREGRKAMVKGKDIGDQLIYLIDKLGVAQGDKSERLFDAVCKYHSEEAERLSRANRTDLITTLEDKVETIKVLLEACPLVKDVTARIKTIFSDQVSGVIFSTIHKAKGLEANRVFILKPELLPHPNAKTAIALEQEDNLKYVAVTRAKFDMHNQGELYFVN